VTSRAETHHDMPLVGFGARRCDVIALPRDAP